MKVAIIGPTYPFRGGIAQHSTLLCNTLRKRHDVKFISYSRQYPKIIFPGKSDHDPSQDALHADPVEYLIDSLNPLSWKKAADSVIQFEPDCVIFPWWVVFWAPQVFYLTKRIRNHLNTKIILLCHNVSEHENNIVKKYITKNILKIADVIFTQSIQETENVHKCLDGVGKKVITGFHPTYVDLCSNMVSDSDKIDKKKYDFQYNLLFFGFVRKYKGLDVLLDALPLVLEYVDVQLNIVGEFWKDKKAYIDKIHTLHLNEYVRIIDKYVPNETLHEYFEHADIVVQPYLSASGSGVSQLAYGFSTPVIATRVGSIAEVVLDKVNGRLVAPNDPKALAMAIIESLVPENLAKMKQEACKVKNRFSWDRFADMITQS